MSYLVLARKYRPRNFSQMVGQEHVVKALGHALEQKRLHHAYLFTGTRGVGKTTVSRILAKSLNCLGVDGLGGITHEPCGVCEACAAIDAGRFVDYTELDAASNRGVEEVQSLLEQAVYKPVQGRFKVFMIDEVHMLSNTAFNAMLKTLEEPPEYLKFVLATTDPQKVPPTVLSRCLQFNLRPMAPGTVHDHLQQVLNSESIPTEPAALALLARAARGSMRDALSLTDQAIAFGSGAVREAQVSAMLGSVDRSYVFGLLNAIAAMDGAGVVETVEVLRVHGLSAASMLDEISAALTRVVVLQAVPGQAQRLIASGDPDSAALIDIARVLPMDEVQLLYSLCLQGKSELGLAPDDYAALTMVLLRLFAFKAPAEKKMLTSSLALAGSDEVVMRSDGCRSVPTTSALPASSVARQVDPSTRSVDKVRDDVSAETTSFSVVEISPNPVSISSSTLGDHIMDSGEGGSEAGVDAKSLDDFWCALVQQLVERDGVTALARELALQSQLVGRDQRQWLLRVERESLNQAGARDRLEGALAEAGWLVSLAISTGEVLDSPARRNAKASAELQQTAEQIVAGNLFVQNMVNEFGAKIVPGSIKPLIEGDA